MHIPYALEHVFFGVLTTCIQINEHKAPFAALPWFPKGDVVVAVQSIIVEEVGFCNEIIDEIGKVYHIAHLAIVAGGG